MDTKPLCECHGEPMYWSLDPRRPPGGYWRCVVRKRGYQLAYLGTENGRRVMREANTRTNARRIRVGKHFYGSFWISDEEAAAWRV